MALSKIDLVSMVNGAYYTKRRESEDTYQTKTVFARGVTMKHIAVGCMTIPPRKRKTKHRSITLCLISSSAYLFSA